MNENWYLLPSPVYERLASIIRDYERSLERLYAPGLSEADRTVTARERAAWLGEIREVVRENGELALEVSDSLSDVIRSWVRHLREQAPREYPEIRRLTQAVGLSSREVRRLSELLARREGCADTTRILALYRTAGDEDRALVILPAEET